MAYRFGSLSTRAGRTSWTKKVAWSKEVRWAIDASPPVSVLLHIPRILARMTRENGRHGSEMLMQDGDDLSSVRLNIGQYPSQ